MLSKRLELGADDDRLLELARHNTKHIRAMIDDLVDDAAARSDKLKVRSEPTDLAPVVRDVLEQLRVIARGRDISLAADIADVTPNAQADAARIRQVLVNLASNAFKHTDAGGIVTLAIGPATDKSGDIELHVADTGCGIDPRNLPRIFDRSFSAGDTVGDGAQSLGLGLYVCREIVHRHGGRIWAESEIGSGTIVRFTVPASMR